MGGYVVSVSSRCEDMGEKMIKALFFFILLITVVSPTTGGASDDFEIKTGCGGGILAIHHSYSINREGDVIKGYHQFVPSNEEEHSTELIGRLPARKVKGFYLDLKRIEFEKIDFQLRRESTCFLSLKTQNGIFRVVWPGALGRPVNIPYLMERYSAPASLIDVIDTHGNILDELAGSGLAPEAEARRDKAMTLKATGISTERRAVKLRVKKLHRAKRTPLTDAPSP